ncbi:MAG TPA: Cof-type HAD-IIB family hydrolase [Candidatus Aquicultor sp.]
MGYKLVALDLDGTLLAKEKYIAESTSERIAEAEKLGVKFTIATGRMSRGALRYAEQLGIDIPIITYNGAVTRTVAAGTVCREYKVPLKGAMQAINLLKGQPVLRYAFVDDEVYTDTPHEWTDRYAELLEVEMQFVDDIHDALTTDPTMLVFMVTELKAAELTYVLREHLNQGVRVTNSAEWFLDVLNEEASKGFALKWLADSLGIAREEVIAIGDNSNDLEMIQYAGLGAAVSNASPGLAAAADYVATLPMCEGVDEIIDKFVLGSAAPEDDRGSALIQNPFL